MVQDALQQTCICERLIGLALGAGVIGPVAKRYAPNLKNQGYQLREASTRRVTRRAPAGVGPFFEGTGGWSWGLLAVAIMFRVSFEFVTG